MPECKNRTMRIDAHHTFDATPERLWPILERNRFEGSVMIQSEPSAEATDRALAIAANLDFVKAVVAWADLASPDLYQRLDQMQADSKLRGIFHTVTADPDPQPLVELVRRGLPIDLVLKQEHLGKIKPLMDRVPELKVILCHMSSPEINGGFDQWARETEQAAKIPNLAMKISGLTSLNLPHPWKAAHLAPFVQHAIACFGPERLLFGSGWPGCRAGGSWKESLAAFTQSIGAHSIDFREQLLGGTAARLYKVLT
jgi:L-fuconolactonase